MTSYKYFTPHNHPMKYDTKVKKACLVLTELETGRGILAPISMFFLYYFTSLAK